MNYIYLFTLIFIQFAAPASYATMKDCDSITPFKLIEIYKFRVNVPVPNDEPEEKSTWSKSDIETFEKYGTGIDPILVETAQAPIVTYRFEKFLRKKSRIGNKRSLQWPSYQHERSGSNEW